MNGLRILIAEDDALIAMYLAEMLVEMGHEVCASESSQAGAVAAAERCRPDLMIVDAGLAPGDGVLAVQQILERGFIPHVFISGDRSRARSLRDGAVMIEKPFHEPQLARAIAAAMAAGPGGPASPGPPAHLGAV
jgi:CheY-like chemotaxis protein